MTNEEQMTLVLAARARSDVDIIIAAASELKVTWREAMAAFPKVFADEAEQTMRRIENARAAKGKGAGNYSRR